MRRFRSLTCPALILGALLFAAGAGAAEKSGGKKAEEPKTEPESRDAEEPDGKKAEEPKPEPERRSADEPSGKKAEERKTEPERPSADKPAKKTTGPLRTSFDFKDTPMTKAVFEIQRLSGLNIVLHQDLARANPTITLRVKNMPLGSALDWICHLAGARYVLVDQAIYIVPKSKTARKK